MTGQHKANAREAVAAGVSLALGLLTAGALKLGFMATPVPPVQAAAVRPAGVAVRMRAPAPASLPPAAATVTPAAPVKVAAAPAPRKVPIQTPDAPTKRDSLPATPPRIDTAPAVALEQPALPEATPLPDLPSLPGLPQLPALPQMPDPAAEPDATAVPAAPPDDYAPPAETYPEQPGGEVLVLGLLVDAGGNVLDTRILVPSHNGLGDLSYAMVARHERITNLTPALEPGQTRWLEVRVHFPKQPILP